MNPRLHGFTLVELMVALAILAILLAIAAPSYRDFVVDSRMSGEANEFLTGLTFARSEAVKRNRPVSMCKSGNGTGCANSGDWEQGWIVFVDLPTGTIGSYDSGTDTILRVHAALNEQSTLVGTTDVEDYVSYVPDGRSQMAGGGAQAGTFDLCTAGVPAAGRQITLALGRATAGKITC